MQIKYSISDEVLVGATKIKGIVIGIYISFNQIKYQVRYIQGGDPKSEYFYEFELSNDTKLPIGFTITKGQ